MIQICCEYLLGVGSGIAYVSEWKYIGSIKYAV